MRLYTHTHTHTSSFIGKGKNKNRFDNNHNGITLVALVVTIVVLLILAGITITYVLGDNSIFKKASDAKLQTDIAKYKEMLETAKVPIIIEGLGTFNPDRYFEYIESQGIIEDKETDVVYNENGTYDVTTKPGYIFEVELMPNKEKPTDVEITYLGQTGKIAPIIKRIEVSATSTSIAGKATVVRLGKGTVTYYYKLKTEPDSSYQEITSVNEETGATQSSGIVAGTEYVIKVVAKNDAGETVDTVEITATKISVESITLNKTEETVKVGEEVTLTAIVKPDNATNKNVTWESNNTSVATVDENGVITGKTAGIATIIASTTDGSNKSITCEITVILPKVADIVGKIQTTTKTVKDENENKVVVPGGFKVVPNGGTGNVTYTYSGDGNPCVQDGIVIEDNEGNQFVWIPVGEIKDKDNTTTITLGRYLFDTTNGTPTLKQNADNYTQTVNIRPSGYGSDFQELTSSSTNTATKNLGDFVTKTKANGGYYLGRYEASNGSGKAKSQYDKTAWVSITQPNAATAARGMYNSSYAESDLINSYSWDTAIVFIQKYSGNSNYANKTTVSSSKLNTGKSGDKVCNIYDMASNCYEWTTEHYTNTSCPCVFVGGSYHIYTNNKSSYYTSHRSALFIDISSQPSSDISSISFRSLLYVK